MLVVSGVGVHAGVLVWTLVVICVGVDAGCEWCGRWL